MLKNRNSDVIIASCKKEMIGKKFDDMYLSEKKIFEGSLPISKVLSSYGQETILQIDKYCYHYSWLNILNPDYGTIKNISKGTQVKYCTFTNGMVSFIGQRLIFIKEDTLYQMVGNESWVFDESWIDFSVLSIKILGEDIRIL